MSGRKTVFLGILTAAVLGTATDAQAIGKRKRGGSDCDCGYVAPCDPCATGGPMWRSDVGPHGAPLAMPGRGTTGVIPADGTRIPATGGVFPATGNVIPGSGVIPASNSYYFDPRTGNYYPRNTVDNQGFVPGVIQGSTGTAYYPAMSPANYAGRRLGGLLRRR